MDACAACTPVVAGRVLRIPLPGIATEFVTDSLSVLIDEELAQAIEALVAISQRAAATLLGTR